MSKIISIALGSAIIEPCIRVADDKAADEYLRRRYGSEISSPRMKGVVWFDGAGASRIMFNPDQEPSVKRALPTLENNAIIWLDTEETFASLQANERKYQIVDA